MNEAVKEKFDSYPADARECLLEIRALIFLVAGEESVGDLEESLKWGEPSYGCKHGSPIRMDWKSKTSDRVSLYFNCKTILVETFREIYGNELECIDSREIALPISQTIPTPILKSCISMALRYHQLKHLPLLGA